MSKFFMNDRRRPGLIRASSFTDVSLSKGNATNVTVSGKPRLAYRWRYGDPKTKPQNDLYRKGYDLIDWDD